ncbi:Ltp family lipoprotein [Enterococcus faecium]|nr:Ltp family lipoprotein [Enterococcus faecium]
MGKFAKFVGYVVIIIVGLSVFVSCVGGSDEETKQEATQETTVVEETQETQETQEVAPETEVIEEEPTEPVTPQVPQEYTNALGTAETLSELFHDSEQGIREQLEFEGFTPEAIEYAITNVGVDYFENAVLKAKDYYESSLNMSAQEVYDQLIFEGFTPEQAQHGVNNL